MEKRKAAGKRICEDIDKIKVQIFTTRVRKILRYNCLQGYRVLGRVLKWLLLLRKPYIWGHYFYENSTSGLFSFLKRWSHRQHTDKRIAGRQTINNRQATLASGFFSYKVTLLACGSGPAQIVFLLIITLLY